MKMDINASFKWNSNPLERFHKAAAQVQKEVDNEVIKQCEPYTPKLTGNLINSVRRGSTIGSGTLVWNAPYARQQYYGTRKAGSETGADRGPQWFERMKARYGAAIIERADKRLKSLL